MQTVAFTKKPLSLAIGACALALATGQAQGAAFALQEQNGSGLGNAYAGGAAVAEDASTVWANPAGMSRFSSINIVAAGSLIAPSIKFRNDGSLAALNQPLGNEGGDAGDAALLPAIYIAVPLSTQFAIGVGIGAPFGLKTDWDDGWMGRYQALLSDVKTLNVNPALSWKVNDRFSIGVGLNYQQVDATFTNNVNYSAALLSAAGQAGVPPAVQGQIAALTPGLDAKANIDGSDHAWGWNIGALFDITRDARIGVHYRSSIKYDVAGNVNFNRPTVPAVPAALTPLVGALSNGVNGVLANGGITAQIELPAFVNASLFAKVSPKWDVMADVQFTQWSSIKELKFVRTTGAVLGSTPENFKDSWRVSGGVNYYYNDQWKLRGGLAWDQTPVQDAERTPRLPDASRLWVAAGAQYTMSRNIKLDLGYAFITADSAPTENQNAGSTAANGSLKGKYDAYVNVLSAQMTYSF
jgi:long-chain fatty acid transport protein